MSWQRIDENTYIDDTLVTCAEYQLFIDEMREQGKYYQPDHWTSYQFPKGHAREPILGVRYLDARGFCEWLTNREGSGWGYRIPASHEVDRFPMQHLHQTPLGFWISDENNDPWFSWIVKDFINPIDYEHSRRIILSIVPTGYVRRDINRAFERVVKRRVDQVLPFDISHILKSISTIVSSLYRAKKFAEGRSIIVEITQALETACHHADELSSIVADREINRAIDCILILARDIDDAIKVTNHRDRRQTSGLALGDVFGLASILDHVLDILIDLIVIIERIAGRSPAFEGIRLVRERMR